LIKTKYSEYLGFNFKEAVKQYCNRVNENDSLPFVFREIGRWWCNNPTKKEKKKLIFLQFKTKKLCLENASIEIQKSISRS
jgi:hypothetical protein